MVSSILTLAILHSITLTKIIKEQLVELAWRSGRVMDCHATARGSIPGGYGVSTESHVLRKG